MHKDDVCNSHHSDNEIKEELNPVCEKKGPINRNRTCTRWAMCTWFLITYRALKHDMLLLGPSMRPSQTPSSGDMLPAKTSCRQRSALHPYKARTSNQPASSSLEQTLAKLFSPSTPSPDESHAAHIGSVKTASAFVSPVLGIHPCGSQWNTHIRVLFTSTLFFHIPSCLTFPAARHSCFFGLSAVFRIVAHTAVPPNSVASYPEGRLLQDGFPFESSFCSSRKDDSFLSSLQALLQWQTWSFIVFIIMMNSQAETMKQCKSIPFFWLQKSRSDLVQPKMYPSLPAIVEHFFQKKITYGRISGSWMTPRIASFISVAIIFCHYP